MTRQSHIFRLFFFSFLSVIAILSAHSEAYARSNEVSRKILAVYSAKMEPELENSRMHRFAEMPLNHLGFVLQYHDISKGIPDVNKLKGYRAVVSWFPPGMKMADPVSYLDFIDQALDKGLKVVTLGSHGVLEDLESKKTSLDRINKTFNRMGLVVENQWISVTYDVKVRHIDKMMMEFEHKMPLVLHPYQKILLSGSANAKSYLSVTSGKEGISDADLVIISDTGGYVAENYAYFEAAADNAEDEEKGYNYRQWHLNPFEFLRLALGSDDLPKPDTTTLAGRRIFYSQIDGDGWNNLSEVPEYRAKAVRSSEVIRLEVLMKYPDLPVTVAPVAADLDPLWAGHPVAQEIARNTFLLPNIEAASHTYSHPFFWEFFESGDNIAREEPYLKNYPYGNWKQSKVKSWFKGQGLDGGKAKAVGAQLCSPEIKAKFQEFQEKNPMEVKPPLEMPKYYKIPRAYANQPYNIEQEICGAGDYISQFLPEGKKLGIVQWSGDTLPYENILALTRLYGIRNINGGDTRFDPEYPSYAWVAPIGLQVGSQQQIYASNSNENTYTKDWSDRYYGFKYLLRTISNTESPMRIKPFNVYYHMYSGEKLASLNAVRNNMDYARTRPFHPIWTSQYAAIADGFYSTRIIKAGPESWTIRDREALDTIRIDKASLKTVDYQQSRGIVGHTYLQGSIYVYLDDAVDEPLITLKDFTNFGKYPNAATPYLINANWRVWDVSKKNEGFSFKTQGFGRGQQLWRLPVDDVGVITITLNGKKINNSHKIETEEAYKVYADGLIEFNFSDPAYAPLEVTVEYSGKKPKTLNQTDNLQSNNEKISYHTPSVYLRSSTGLSAAATRAGSGTDADARQAVPSRS